MTSTIEASIDRALEGRRLLEHPFYRRWEAGHLSVAELRSYAAQYVYFERMLPSFLEELDSLAPAGRASDAISANLRDELGPPSHLGLFDGFAEAVGATDELPSPAMSALVHAYWQLLRSGVDAGLAGLAAYESQGAEIAATKAEGLERHYGVGAMGLAFWRAHCEQESTHARWTFEGLEAVSPRECVVSSSARSIAEAWWAFLDEREELAATLAG